MSFAKKYVATFSAVVLSVIIVFAFAQWYRPDVRFTEERWYKDPATTTHTLILTNVGPVAAEEVEVTATFTNRVQGVSTNDQGVRFTRTAERNGGRTVSGKISIIGAGQRVYVFFRTADVKIDTSNEPFVESVIFQGGEGRTGSLHLREMFAKLPYVVLGAFIGITALLIIGQSVRTEKATE